MKYRQQYENIVFQISSKSHHRWIIWHFWEWEVSETREYNGEVFMYSNDFSMVGNKINGTQ